MAAKQVQYIRNGARAYVCTDAYSIIDAKSVALEDTLDAIYAALGIDRPTGVRVTFVVKMSTGQRLPNASIAINGQTGITDANGECIFYLQSGTYEYTVTFGEATTTDAITVEQTTTVEVTLDIALATMTVTVLGTDSTPLPNLLFTVNSSSMRTDANGQLIINAPLGSTCTMQHTLGQTEHTFTEEMANTSVQIVLYNAFDDETEIETELT